MKVVMAYKAQRINRDEPTESLSIICEQELPKFVGAPSGTQRLAHEHDAAVIAKALRDTLPGGTFDRLIGELLRMKASDLVVSYGD